MLTTTALCYRFGHRSARMWGCRDGNRVAVDQVSAQAGGGRVVALVGRNGSGKSTLLRLIAGLIAPSSGSVRWEGADPIRLDGRDRARRIAFVSQRPTLSIDLSVAEAVGLGRYAMGENSESARRVEHAICEMGLESFSARSFHELSAGEQQRCVMARALAQHESQGLLALDEPFSNLDPGEVSRVACALRVRANAGALVVVALHDLALADQLADEVWWLETGELIARGAPSDVLTTARLRQVFGCEFVRGSVDQRLELKIFNG